jgi:hypothetical protein
MLRSSNKGLDLPILDSLSNIWRSLAIMKGKQGRMEGAFGSRRDGLWE